ncbi:MAG TPA: glycosyltransferase family 4 protein [Solirubrobacteraceae bacterium]
MTDPSAGGSPGARVLLLHNRYRSLGGEERTVRDIADLLERRGHEVELLERWSDGAGRVRAARGLLGGGVDPESVKAAVRLLRADVVHAHNLHPLFGWRALAAARGAGARTVLHLHNFRLFCAIGIAYRDGRPCHRCRGRDTRPGLRLRCRGPLGESAVYATGLRLQQPHLFAQAERFVAVSRAHGARLVELGLPAEKTATLPNFVPDERFAAASSAGEGSYALVSGRLVEEKGFDTAVRAAVAAGVPLVVAGEGPDRLRLESLAAGGDVRFMGLLSPERLAEVRTRAAVVLAPSRCEEACPYSVLDAFASGVPVLASDRGGLPELVGSALPPEDLAAWTERLASLWADPVERERLGAAALDSARERFGEERYYRGLMAVYGED